MMFGLYVVLGSITYCLYLLNECGGGFRAGDGGVGDRRRTAAC
jgi:hypothetical protein